MSGLPVLDIGRIERLAQPVAITFSSIAFATGCVLVTCARWRSDCLRGSFGGRLLVKTALITLGWFRASRLQLPIVWRLRAALALPEHLLNTGRIDLDPHGSIRSLWSRTPEGAAHSKNHTTDRRRDGESLRDAVGAVGEVLF